MAKIKTRIVTGIDWVGDFYAKAQVYVGFFVWKTIERHWSVGGRNPLYAINSAECSIDNYRKANIYDKIIKYPENQ